MTDPLHPIDKRKMFFIGIPAFTYLSDAEFSEIYGIDAQNMMLKIIEKFERN